MSQGCRVSLNGDGETAKVDYVSALEAHVVDRRLLRCLSALCDALPNCEVIVDDMIAEDDKVAVRFAISNRRSGNDRVSVPGILIYRVAENKIVEHWMQPEVPVLLQMLEAAAA
jgi:predicted ester cyclase